MIINVLLVFMSSTCYSCQILTKLVRVSNTTQIQFHENLSSGAVLFHGDRQTDRQTWSR